MTREHKLALIVGFSLLLLVGVLISDHLSRARQSRLDEVTLEPAAMLESSRPAPVDPLRPVVRTQPPPTQQAEYSPSGPAVGVREVALASEPTLDLSEPRRDVATPGPLSPSPTLGGDGTLEDAILGSGGTIARDRDGVSDFTLGNPAGERDAVDTQRNPGMPAGADQTHVVRKNETLYAIAKKHYGDGKLWLRLAEYNKDKVGAGGAIREGQSLRIPSIPTLTGKPAASPARPAPASPRTLASETRIASAKTYTVRKNDTLGDVSRAMYGTSKRWREILAANKSLIDDEDHLLVGMKLKVPG